MSGRGKNPNSLKNLVQFKKGQSGNPNGGSRKATERKNAKALIKKITKDIELGEPFSPEERKIFWEFIRSLPPEQFMRIASDKRLPMGALIDLKASSSDFTEGSTRNTDRIERQIYGSRGSVDVSGTVNSGPMGIDSIGFVFGGIDIDSDE